MIHKITYFGGKRAGFAWRCECGVEGGTRWLKSSDRAADVRIHLISVEREAGQE